MGFKKIMSEQIFTGTKILSDVVLILDEENRVVDIVNKEQAGEEILELKGILSPAFVNCHCHLELSHMKGLAPEASGLLDFVGHIMRQRQFPLDEILEAIANADREMYENGIAAVGDICNTPHTLNTKAQSNIQYRNFIEIAGFLPEQADARWQHGVTLRQQMEAVGPSTIVPHAPYSVSKILFDKINNDSVGQTISIHNQESRYENLLYQFKKGAFLKLYEGMKADISFFEPSGKTSIQTYLPWLDKVANILLIHNTFSSKEDLLFAESIAKENHQQLYWTLCPNANWYIERLQPPVDILREAGVKICLGTDSIASNYNLSILTEIERLRFNFPEVSTLELLQWATINGAKALGMDTTLGSFEKGKRPGVILITEDLSDVKRVV